MPSDKVLGEFDKLSGPIKTKYGDWSQRWDAENAKLRYEPPHRPIVRLTTQKQPTYIKLQHEMRDAHRNLLSDSDNIYRLPNFNVHRTDILVDKEMELERPQTAPAKVTAWQTPGEAQSLTTTRGLNERSRGGTPPSNANSSQRRLNRELGSFESFFGAKKPLRRHSFGSESVDESVTSSLGTDLNVSELLKQSMRPSTNVRGASDGNIAVEIRPSTPPPPTEQSSLPRSMSGSPRGGENDGASKVSLSKGSVTSTFVYALEANGEGEAFIPHSSMPNRRGLKQNFATYPPIALKRDGLHHRQNKSVHTHSVLQWPSQDIYLAQRIAAFSEGVSTGKGGGAAGGGVASKALQSRVQLPVADRAAFTGNVEAVPLSGRAKTPTKSSRKELQCWEQQKRAMEHADKARSRQRRMSAKSLATQATASTKNQSVNVDLQAADRPRVYAHLEGSPVQFEALGRGHAALIDHVAGRPRDSSGRMVVKGEAARSGAASRKPAT
mmetsp:Transcript_15449/g.30983  ORF Transcript_15449/g.30983 Transcript_15449/m.30983 type:complete len:496 (-) Transcript_15449:117-1604(-)